MKNIETIDVVLGVVCVFLAGVLLGTFLISSSTTSEYPPQNIKVGPYNYLLRFEEPRILQQSRPESKGYTWFQYRLIVVDQSLTIVDKKEVVIHELFHACRDIGGSHYDQSDSDSAVFEAIVPTFMQVMHDNPELEKWLFH